jgi:hypothetical protein
MVAPQKLEALEKEETEAQILMKLKSFKILMML